jgi:hypothetical protein
MTKTIAFICLLLASTAAYADETKPYTNETWGFTAEFPKAYPIKEAPNSFDGLTVSASSSNDSIAYMISTFTITNQALAQRTSDRILEDAVAGALSNVKGTLTYKSVISLHGYPGRAFNVKTDSFIAICRIYLIGNRVYLPMVIYVPNANDAALSVLPMTVEAFHQAFDVRKLGK